MNAPNAGGEPRATAWKFALRATAVLFPLILFPAAPAAVAEEAKCTIYRFPDLPVTMEELRPLVHAQINGKDALFLADSGAFFSTIAPEAVPQFQMYLDSSRERFYIEGVGGAEAAQVAVAKTFGMLDKTWSHVEFVAAGRPLGSGAIGVLGQNVFRMGDVEYDLANGVIRLVVPKGNCKNTSLAYWAQEANKPYSVIDIDFATAASPHTRSVAYLNGAKIRVLFDTGAAGSVLTLAAAKRAGITPTSPGVTAGGQGRGFGYRTAKTFISRFDSFKIGDEEIQHARLRFGDIELSNADMLVGSDFFLSHRIYVASSQRRLYFTYNGGPVFDLTTASTASADAQPGAAGSAGSQQTPSPSAEAQGAPGAAADAAPSASAAGLAGTAGATAASAKPLSTQASSLLDTPTDAAGFSRRAAASVSRRDYPHALADLTRACELAPTESGYFYQRGMVYWQSRQGDAALADFDQAIKLKADSADALVARAELRAARHEPTAPIITDLEAADRALPADADLRLQIAGSYTGAYQPAAAVPLYSKWIEAHPRDHPRMPSALNERCWARALAAQDLTQALDDCNTALKLRPNSAQILDSRGLVYLRQGNYDKSIADYDAALRLQPKIAWSLYGRGIAKLRKGLNAEGHADLAAATAVDPKIAEVAGKYGVTP